MNIDYFITTMYKQLWIKYVFENMLRPFTFDHKYVFNLLKHDPTHPLGEMQHVNRSMVTLSLLRSLQKEISHSSLLGLDRAVRVCSSFFNLSSLHSSSPVDQFFFFVRIVHHPHIRVTAAAAHKYL